MVTCLIARKIHTFKLASFSTHNLVTLIFTTLSSHISSITYTDCSLFTFYEIIIILLLCCKYVNYHFAFYNVYSVHYYEIIKTHVTPTNTIIRNLFLQYFV